MGGDPLITEQDLLEAIAECQGEKNPNANTCVKLAAFLTIRKELFGDDTNENQGNVPSYSFSYPSTQVDYTSDTEFGQSIVGMDTYSLMVIMDELMSALQIVNPKLYNSVMRRIQ
jgi:hypothetical protein